MLTWHILIHWPYVYVYVSDFSLSTVCDSSWWHDESSNNILKVSTPMVRVVSYPDSFYCTRKKSLVKCICNFDSALNVRDALWCSNNSTIHVCTIIRVHAAEILASPKPWVNLAELKRRVTSLIACWTNGSQPSLGSFKLLSQTFFKRGCDVDAVLQSDWVHPDLAARNQNCIHVSPDPFSVCDIKRVWVRDYGTWCS